jgi:hypothetical protein
MNLYSDAKLEEKNDKKVVWDIGNYLVMSYVFEIFSMYMDTIL